MLEKLGNILKKTTDKIANAIFLDKDLVDSIIKDLQRALIEADVNIHLVKELSDKLRKEAFDERIKGIEKKEHLIKLLHDEIQKLVGEEKKELELKNKDTIIFLGLYGSGKTTTIAKLALYYKKRGKKVAVIGLDVHRPAASEQLKQLAEKNSIDYFISSEEKNPEKIWKVNKKELENYDLVLVDTAGRDALEKSLIKEIKDIADFTKANHKILVLPADIGQTAKNQASEFQKAVGISGVIITRMDSSAKAGGALTACAETNAPVYFIGTGEHINDIETFNPKSFITRLLGIGDLETLIEKVKFATDEGKQKEIQKRIEQGQLSLLDVIEQVKSMNSMGGFSKIKDLIPGLGKAKLPDNILDNQENKIKKWEHIVKSMTKEEINNPEIIEKQTSRISRIAKGSGATTSEVRALLKQYKLIKEMTKGSFSDGDFSQGLSQKQMMKLAKKLGKKKIMRF